MNRIVGYSVVLDFFYQGKFVIFAQGNFYQRVFTGFNDFIQIFYGYSYANRFFMTAVDYGRYFLFGSDFRKSPFDADTFAGFGSNIYFFHLFPPKYLQNLVKHIADRAAIVVAFNGVRQQVRNGQHVHFRAQVADRQRIGND